MCRLVAAALICSTQQHTVSSRKKLLRSFSSPKVSRGWIDGWTGGQRISFGPLRWLAKSKSGSAAKWKGGRARHLVVLRCSNPAAKRGGRREAGGGGGFGGRNSFVGLCCHADCDSIHYSVTVIGGDWQVSTWDSLRGAQCLRSAVPLTGWSTWGLLAQEIIKHRSRRTQSGRTAHWQQSAGWTLIVSFHPLVLAVGKLEVLCVARCSSSAAGACNLCCLRALFCDAQGSPLCFAALQKVEEHFSYITCSCNVEEKWPENEVKCLKDHKNLSCCPTSTCSTSRWPGWMRTFSDTQRNTHKYKYISCYWSISILFVEVYTIGGRQKK